MFRSKRMSILFALLLALVLGSGCSGCTDGTGEESNGTNNYVEPDVAPPGSKLLHVNDGGSDPCNPAQDVCAKNVTFSSSIPLTVQLVDPNNAPIGNTSINFELAAGNATGTTLSSSSAVTGNDGLATTDIRAGTTAGTAEVTVSAGGAAAGVAPIKFIVAVNSKGSSSYIVKFNHNGTADLKDIKVRAFAANTTCAQVVEDHQRETTPNVNPVLTAVTQALGIVGADGTPGQVVIPNVPNGTAYTIEARAMSRANPDVESAFGCKDMNPAVQNGESVEVTVDLVDNLPRIAGEYGIVHTFSIQDIICAKDPNTMEYDGVLPGGVCTAIDLIGRLATDPGSFLVGDDMGNDGLLQLLVDFLPDGSIKNTILSFLDNNFIRNLAGNVINDFARDWINMNAPSWVRNAINITGDLYETLKEFRVNGTIRISTEPRPDFDPASGAVIGLLEADAMGNKPGKQIWNEVVVYWTGECPAGNDACRERTFSANDVGTNNVVEGYFTGSVVPTYNDQMRPTGYGLIIDDHTLTLNYGVFILGVLEKIVLPSVFDDPSVNSLEAALDALISGIFGGGNGCDGFGQWIDEEVGGGGSVAESLCNNLISGAGDWVRDYLSENLTVSGEDNFLIGTPDGIPCQLHEPELYQGEWNGKPLPYIEKLGENRPGFECQWDLKIKFGGDAADVVVSDGIFYGSRTGF